MLTAAVCGGVCCGMNSVSDELACCEISNDLVSGTVKFSASRILLLDSMFASLQMNTQTLINFLYIILLVLKQWKF